MTENTLLSTQHFDAEPCPECGASLRVRHSGKNSFLGCESYPNCQYTRSLYEPTDFEPQALPGEQCPECGHGLLLKKGRYGFFVGCSHFPTCHYMLDPNSTVAEQAVSCPFCQKGALVQRTSRYGRSFYACDTYPECRYSVNDEPVAKVCPECAWPLLVKSRTKGRQTIRCPQKTCDYRAEL